MKSKESPIKKKQYKKRTYPFLPSIVTFKLLNKYENYLYACKTSCLNTKQKKFKTSFF